MSDSEIRKFQVGSTIDFARNSFASKEGTKNYLPSETKEETRLSKTIVEVDRTIEEHILITLEGKDYLVLSGNRLWKSCVYMITLGYVDCNAFWF